MSGAEVYAAVDLGAESGRVAACAFDGGRIAVEEVHRFPNRPLTLPDGLHWDAGHLFAEILAGLARSSERGLASVGIDGWGVDFALLDRDGALLGLPFHHRDRRTRGVAAEVAALVPPAEIYARTGIQFMPINTLDQLVAARGSAALEGAETLLLVPDLLRHWLTGERLAEATNASTTQLLNARTRDWDVDLIERLGLPAGVFPPVVAPGTRGVPIRAELAAAAGVGGAPDVALVCSHDTASAVVAVPAESPRFAYVSCGTWSLVGLELAGPVLGTGALEANLSNELGYGGTVRFLRNVMGLWLLQECRRTWLREGVDLDYEAIARLAGSGVGLTPLIDPDRPEFLAPGDMPERIAAACRATGQEPPASPVETARCIMASLACKYRFVLELAERVAGTRADVLHVVGGGARNGALCRLTAEVLGRPVLAGPAEATALGNGLVQAAARGRLVGLAEMREVVRASVAVEAHEPAGEGAGEEWYGRFLELTGLREGARALG